MNRIIAAALLWLCSSMAHALFSVTGNNVPGVENLDKAYTDYMQAIKATSGSVAVVKDGRLVLVRGYGTYNAKTGAKTHPDTLFRVASLSKFLGAATAMKLVEDGRLSLDARVFGSTGILYDLQPFGRSTPIDARMSAITVRHLLNHTTGWGTSWDPMFREDLDEIMGLGSRLAECRDVIRYMIGQVPLSYAPGTNHKYYNLNYCILGRVIEKVTGKSYWQVAKESILDRVGATSAQIGRSRPQNRPADETEYVKQPESPLVTSLFGDGLVPMGDGGYYLERHDVGGALVLTAKDYLKIINGLDRRSLPPDILADATLAQMTACPQGVANQPCSNSAWYAMGTAVNQAGNWWHEGGLTDSTRSMFIRSSGGVTWIATFNSLRTAETPTLDTTMWAAINSVSAWPAYDLFAGNPYNRAPQTNINAPFFDAAQGCLWISGTATDDRWIKSVLVQVGSSIWNHATQYIGGWYTSFCGLPSNYNPAQYSIAAVATDNQNATSVATINLAPVARISAPSSALAGQAITFNGSGSSDVDGYVASYAWNFGDGGIAAGSVVSHTYSAPGSYSVTLTVTDNHGATHSSIHTVTVRAASNDLSIASHYAVASTVVGIQDWYGFQVFNNGPDTAANVNFYAYFSAELDVLNVYGSSCAETYANQVQCSILSLAKGTPTWIWVEAKAIKAGSALSYGYVSNATNDPNSNNNYSIKYTTVNP